MGTNKDAYQTVLDVIVVGDLSIDNFYLVPHIPTWDEGVLVYEWYEHAGGKGGNTAATLSRLGTSSGIIAPVGTDRYGRKAVRGLKKNGVDIQGIITVTGAKTYYCIMMLDATGEKATLVACTGLMYPDANSLEEREAYITSATHLHVIGLDPLRMLPALKIARLAGMSVSIDLDAGYQGYDACRPAIALSDIVFINRMGVESVFPGKGNETVISEILSLGPSIAVVTLGGRGAIAGDRSGIVKTGAFKVKPVDTTGAGDAFSGALVHACLNGWDLQKALTFSCAVGAMATSAIGGQNALPTEEEVWQFIDRHAA